MPYVKLATAARRARMGSVTAIRRALVAAGAPLVTLSPGVVAVDESDLDGFLAARNSAPKEPAKPIGPSPSEGASSSGPMARKKARKRRQ
jgi:hypothetical protein